MAAEPGCASPRAWSMHGIDSLRACRAKPVNGYATSACLDLRPADIPPLPQTKKALCAQLDAQLRRIAGDASDKALSEAVAATAGLLATTVQSMVAMADLAGGYASGTSREFVLTNLGRDGMAAALMSPAAFAALRASLLDSQGNPAGGLGRAMAKGVDRFAYVARADVRLEPAARWRYEATLRIEAGDEIEQHIAIAMAGRFDPSFVGDVNLAGIVIEEYSATKGDHRD